MSKILFIRYKKPGAIPEGGEMLSQIHLDALCQKFGRENVEVFHIHNDDHHRSLSQYLAAPFLFLFDYHFGLTPRKVRTIISRLDKYDCLFIDRSVFGLIAKKAKKSGYGGKVIVFFHNVEKDYFDAKMPHFPGRGIIIRCADRNDALTCRYSDSVLALNSRDAGIIESCYGRTPDAYLPIILKDQYLRDSYPNDLTKSRPRCLFLGSYFPANVDGLEWFMDNVLPFVDITFDIVGKGLEKLSGEKYKAPNVNVIANVPSLEPYFEKADIMILPIFKGSGMKVKTCESLMYGKNIIGSTEAFEGYQGDFSKIGAKCDTAQEFIDAINGFSNTPRPVFNIYSRNLFLEKYSFNRIVETLDKVIDL